MPIFSIYRDFLKFLDQVNEKEGRWELYQRLYLNLHRDFLFCYWEHFTLLDLERIGERVERIRRRDYGNLLSLLQEESPEEIIEDALRSCERVFRAPEEPAVYLIVGFFSSEGFVVKFNGHPVIGIGLERFRDFRPLGLILAHEYCHYLRLLVGEDTEPPERRTLGAMLLSEGLSSLFSEKVFPERPLNEHLYLSRPRLNWCISNEDYLKDLVRRELRSQRLIPALFKTGSQELGIPPRVGGYLGYRLLKRYETRTGATISQLLNLHELPYG